MYGKNILHIEKKKYIQKLDAKVVRHALALHIQKVSIRRKNYVQKKYFVVQTRTFLPHSTTCLAAALLRSPNSQSGLAVFCTICTHKKKKTQKRDTREHQTSPIISHGSLSSALSAHTKKETKKETQENIKLLHYLVRARCLLHYLHTHTKKKREKKRDFPL